MADSAPDEPARGAFLTAEWRWLAMLNYEMPPALLRPLVPAGTELDAWNGVTYASVVGFRFLNTRVLGIPIPFHRNFEELNLRFYVRRKGPEGWRRGVVFIKEIVPRMAIAAVARWVYNENYAALPMRHRVTVRPGTGGDVEYGWRHRRRPSLLRVAVTGDSAPLVAGSEEEFITEHYWGYARQRDGGCVEYQVQHPRWNVWRAESAVLDGDVGALYGSAFAECLSGPPRSALLADGSPVTVRRGVRIV
ncbi:YqjF family protein [Longimicrobium terrae]|uniref:DUF2071 domain-containing protein n=1 Tax=Longimicrobium terrae TaxID=1639882 RepID=A0A841GY67_9BACT|nr:DUF2071 domain-containing protein [Longimicrobium terrae]MBB4636274.1 hypothetical protein [Longimicrobium terrae]MBB6070669.1 hypothetical protein [Longimicrobium terrae]NNC29652.1 DUF2071 domain-containing protein [Longimicrobium terrae]